MDAQTAIALVIVGGCGLYLARMGYRFWRGKGPACGSCQSCESEKKKGETGGGPDSMSAP